MSTRLLEIGRLVFRSWSQRTSWRAGVVTSDVMAGRRGHIGRHGRQAWSHGTSWQAGVVTSDVMAGRRGHIGRNGGRGWETGEIGTGKTGRCMTDVGRK